MNSLNKTFSKRKIIILFVFMAIFLFKGIFYAVYLSAPTIHTTPDDVGHVSYIQYIYANKTLPVYGASIENISSKSYVENVKPTAAGNYDYLGYTVENEQFDSISGINWIVQHPPAYYLYMTPFYALGKLFTNNLAYLIIIMRLATLILGVLSVFVVSKILDCIGVGETAHLSVLTAYVFFAPIQFFFSSITNDSMTFLFCLISLLFLLRFVYLKKKRDFYFFAISSAIVVMSKYTGALVIIAYLVFLFYKCLKDYKLKHTLSLFVQGIGIAAVIDGPYFIRNLVKTGSLFPMASDPKNYDYTFWQFISCGYFDELFRNLTSLLGWKVMLPAGTANVFGLAVLLFVAFIAYLIADKSKRKKLFVGIMIAFCAVMIPLSKFAFNIRFRTAVILTFVIAILIMAIYEWVKNRENKKLTINMFFAGITAFVFLFFLYKHYNVYNSRGHTGAMHGRYYYTAIFPMLFLIFNKFDAFNTKIKKYVPSLVLIFMVSNELLIIKNCVINF